MRPFLLILVSLFFFGGTAMAEDADNPLAIFEGLIGTWAGPGTNPDDPGGDIMRFEWILGGRAVQHTHTLENGTYGGRTIYFWDRTANDGAGGIIYHYFTTAGFHTQGTAAWEDGKFSAHEFVEGNENVREVRGGYEPREDGGWTSTSEYLTAEGWVTGHGFIYSPAPDAEIVFGRSGD